MWQSCIHYEEYIASHPTIQQFWAMLAGWPNDLKLRLFEYVTGSRRISLRIQDRMRAPILSTRFKARDVLPLTCAT